MSEKVYPREMHTAEHILGGTMVRRFGCPRAVTTHLEKKKSKVDFPFGSTGRNLTPEEVEQIASCVNEQIARELEVTSALIPREEAAAEFDLSRLPEDAGDELRVVSVGDYDRCPCIGEHVENTREIGRLRIISTDYDPQSQLLRMRFKLERLP